MAFPSLRGKLALAAYLEQHSDFRLATGGSSLSQALQQLDSQPHQYEQEFVRAHKLFQRCAVGLFLLCALLGTMAVPSALLGPQNQQVNIFWLLLILLGMHGLNLLLWCVSLLISPFRNTPPNSFLLSILVFVNNKLAPLLKLSPHVSAAYLQWQCHPYSNKWLLGVLSHAGWGIYLFAGWLMSVLLLLTNQVTFVWETTLLDEQAFLTITELISWLPEQLGIAVPNQLDILGSPVDVSYQTEQTRQHWANLLLASLMLYGVLPRVLGATISLMMLRIKRYYLPLSSHEQALQKRFQPTQYTSDIVDADHSTADDYRAEPATTSPLPKQALLGCWGLYEWMDTQPKALASAQSVTILNDRQAQQRFLAQQDLASVYLLVNPQTSPDRGTQRFITQIKQACPDLALVIYHEAPQDYRQDWQQLATRAGIRLYLMTTEGAI